jgi:hypothetical protein
MASNYQNRTGQSGNVQQSTNSDRQLASWFTEFEDCFLFYTSGEP